MTRFAGKVVLVTGGAQGIGRGIADRFAAEGADVVILDIEKDTLDQTVEELRARGSRAEGVNGDVTQLRDVHRAVQTTVEKFGGLHVLVGVAGIVEFAPFLEVTESSWNRILDVNLTGMFLATQEAARVMAAAGGGAIVLIASTNAFFAEAHTVPYTTSKAGIHGLVRAAALDLAQHNIRINAINPGQIVTRLSRILVDDPIGGPAVLASIPLGRWGQPADIAAVAAFLASDDAAYMTGENVTVDAGMTIGTVLDVEDQALGEHGSKRAARVGDR